MLFLDAPLRMAVRAVKGGGGKPFIGAKRRPLTEQAGGTGACFASEEQLKLVRDFYRREGGEVFKRHTLPWVMAGCADVLKSEICWA